MNNLMLKIRGKNPKNYENMIIYKSTYFLLGLIVKLTFHGCFHGFLAFRLYSASLKKKADNTIQYINFNIDTINIMQVLIVSILFHITSSFSVSYYAVLPDYDNTIVVHRVKKLPYFAAHTVLVRIFANVNNYSCNNHIGPAYTFKEFHITENVYLL